MSLLPPIDRLKRLWHLGRKRFRSPDDYIELMRYLAEDFAGRVVRPEEYAGGLVLDAGCSYGAYMEAFKANGAADVVGVDLTIEGLRTSGIRSGVVGDMTAAPFNDNTFDFVYSRGVIEHVPDQLAFCRECFRILKPNGYICMTAPPWYSPNAGHPRLKPFHLLPFPVARFLAEKTRNIKIDATDLSGLGLYPITIRKLKNFLAASGFELERTGDALLGMDWLARIPVLNEILVQHVYVVGRRRD